jgi:hypothetical protein
VIAAVRHLSSILTGIFRAHAEADVGDDAQPPAEEAQDPVSRARRMAALRTSVYKLGAGGTNPEAPTPSPSSCGVFEGPASTGRSRSTADGSIPTRRLQTRGPRGTHGPSRTNRAPATPWSSHPSTRTASASASAMLG